MFELQPWNCRECFRASAAAVSFKEDTSPENEPYADYYIACEAAFEPATLDRAWLSIAVDMDGRVAIGVERCGRVVERLGVRSTFFGRLVVAGHEPVNMEEKVLIALLELVANGRIAIAATVAPLLGLLEARAVTLDKWTGPLKDGSFLPSRWLKVLRQDAFPDKRSVLRYRPW